MNAKGRKESKDQRNEMDQPASALALVRIWCEAAEAWRRQPSNVTAARCRAARDSIDDRRARHWGG
jgi:hypothetical protein